MGTVGGVGWGGVQILKNSEKSLGPASCPSRQSCGPREAVFERPPPDTSGDGGVDTLSLQDRGGADRSCLHKAGALHWETQVLSPQALRRGAAGSAGLVGAALGAHDHPGAEAGDWTVAGKPARGPVPQSGSHTTSQWALAGPCVLRASVSPSVMGWGEGLGQRLGRACFYPSACFYVA